MITAHQARRARLETVQLDHKIDRLLAETLRSGITDTRLAEIDRELQASYDRQAALIPTAHARF